MLTILSKTSVPKISGGGERATHVKEVVKHSNPLLEAFGKLLLLCMIMMVVVDKNDDIVATQFNQN